MRILTNSACVVFVLCCVCSLSVADLDDWWKPARTAKKFRAGEPTFIYTHGSRSWNQPWYTVPDRHEFVFSVKSCNHVRIALTTYIGVTDMTVEIVLGDEENTKSMIKYPFEMGNLHEAYTPELLHCHEYRTFWVAWHLDYIEVGRGPTIAQQKILNWFDKSLHTINVIGLSSGGNTAAAWEIRGNTGDLIELATPAEYKYTTYWKSVKDREFYSFQVRACGDVHVLLTEELGRQDGDLYEISIGGWNNNKTVIRTAVYGGGASIKAERQEYGVVHCSEFTELWVSWYNNTISVGRGDIYAMTRILHWDSDIQVDVRYLSVTTGFGNTGQWLFNDDEETINMVHTPHSNSSLPNEIYNTTWIEMPKEKYFQFWVKSNEDARILLADDNNILDEEFDLQITIGGENKRKVCVGYMFEPGCLAEYEDTDDFMSYRHFRPFWISWFNHSLSMGKGYFYGERPMISGLPLVPDFPINAIALATTRSPGRWKFREYMGERLDYRTPNYYTNYQDVCLWRTVYTKQWFLFYFSGDSDAHITLSPTFGINHESTYYDIIISGWDNTKSVITEVSNYGNNRKEVSESFDTTGLLTSNGNTEIWVSWYNSFIEVGVGTIVGEKRFLHHNFVDGLDVRALSVQTGWGHVGRWWLYENLGDYTTFYTNGTLNPNEWKVDQYMVMDAFLRFVTFWVQSCSEATIYIGSRQGEQKFDHYRVVLGAEGNTRVIIYHGDVNVASVERSSIGCGGNAQYWISWKDGKLEVGDGYKYPFGRFIEATQPATYNLTYLGFGTAPHAQAGRFHLQHAYGPDFEMYTSYDYAYKNWFTVEHKDYVFFSVQACSDVHILLSEKMGHQWGYSYEIVLGGWNNSRSVIREWLEDEHGQRMPEYVVKETPQLLNCTGPKLFWVSWQDGVIMIGDGIFFDGYRNSWIDYHPINPRPVRALAFSTGYNYNGYWAINLQPDVVAPPVTEPPITVEPEYGESSQMSGGAIAGIVIAVLAVIALFGAVGYLVMVTRGNVQTPDFLQTPAEGSGFENPVASQESQDDSNA